MNRTAIALAPPIGDGRSPETHRTRLAVFGSVAAARPVAGEEPPTVPPVRAVLEQVLASIAQHTPSIAEPILDRALAEGKITRVERHALLRELGDPEAARPPEGAAASSVPARRVLREVLAAVRRAAPTIAEPILDAALDSERLTAAQRQRVLERLRTSPPAALRQRPTAEVAGSVFSAA